MIDKTSLLNTLADDCHEIAVEHGFWGKSRDNIGEKLMLVVTEVTEAMEKYRNGEPLGAWTREMSGKPVGFGVELADILIRVLDIAANYQIDIGGAVKCKMQYNRTREYKHGGKIS